MWPKSLAEFIPAKIMSRDKMVNLGASVNGKPTVSKTVTAGSSPAAPVVLKSKSGRKMLSRVPAIKFLYAGRDFAAAK